MKRHFTKVLQGFMSITLLLFTSLLYGQAIDIEKEFFPGTKKLIIKPFNGCSVRKAFKEIYYFDKDGKAIKSFYYFKNELRGSYKYHYDEKGLLVEEIQVSGINNKNKKDTTKYYYTFDTSNRITSKTKKNGRWSAVDKFSDFDSSNNPQMTQHLFNTSSIFIKRQYNSRGQEILRQGLSNNRVTEVEESKYNEYGDKIYSNATTLLDKETGKMISLLGGDRHTIVKVYKYTYDKLNRWTEKYVVFDDKEVLLEKRIYK